MATSPLPPDPIFPTHPEPDSVKHEVFTAIGQASMCWSTIPTGVFESTSAEQIGRSLLRFFQPHLEHLKLLTMELFGAELDEGSPLAMLRQALAERGALRGVVRQAARGYEEYLHDGGPRKGELELLGHQLRSITWLSIDDAPTDPDLGVLADAGLSEVLKPRVVVSVPEPSWPRDVGASMSFTRNGNLVDAVAQHPPVEREGAKPPAACHFEIREERLRIARFLVESTGPMPTEHPQPIRRLAHLIETGAYADRVSIRRRTTGDLMQDLENAKDRAFMRLQERYAELQGNVQALAAERMEDSTRISELEQERDHQRSLVEEEKQRAGQERAAIVRYLRRSEETHGLPLIGDLARIVEEGIGQVEHDGMPEPVADASVPF